MQRINPVLLLSLLHTLQRKVGQANEADLSIVLTPDQGELRIELKGNLAAMLGAAQNAKRSPETGDLSLQVVMVAGARNKLYRQLCWAAA